MTSAGPPEYFLLLNADTLVHSVIFVALVRFMDTHAAARIAESGVFYSNGSKQPSTFHFHEIASELDRGLQLGIVPGSNRGGAAPYRIRVMPAKWIGYPEPA